MYNGNLFSFLTLTLWGDERCAVCLSARAGVQGGQVFHEKVLPNDFNMENMNVV